MLQHNQLKETRMHLSVKKLGIFAYRLLAQLQYKNL